MNFFSLLSPKIFSFYLKQYIFVKKCKGKLYLKKYRLKTENSVDIIIENNSKLNLGAYVTIRKGSDIQVLDTSTVNIGDNFFMNKNSSVVARYGITIGDNCMIGESTSIMDHNHAFDNIATPFKSQGYVGKQIFIGNNVWIAGRVFIGQGVTIGDNVVIGANTIVTKDIPSNSVVYGKTDLIIKKVNIYV